MVLKRGTSQSKANPTHKKHTNTHLVKRWDFPTIFHFLVSFFRWLVGLGLRHSSVSMQVLHPPPPPPNRAWKSKTPWYRKHMQWNGIWCFLSWGGLFIANYLHLDKNSMPLLHAARSLTGGWTVSWRWVSGCCLALLLLVWHSTAIPLFLHLAKRGTMFKTPPPPFTAHLPTSATPTPRGIAADPRHSTASVPRWTNPWPWCTHLPLWTKI